MLFDSFIRLSIIMKSEEKFHVFTLESSGEYRYYTNFYWQYTYYITVIDQ